MGAMKDLFIKQIEELGNSKKSRFDVDKLMDAWEDWMRNGYRLTCEQPDKPRFSVFIPEGAETLSCKSKPRTCAIPGRIFSH